jgi:hypothetical protein
MKFTASLLAYASQAATLAELILQDPNLSSVAGQIANNPLWSAAGNVTLFAPTNAAVNSAQNLPAGYVGTITHNQPFSWYSIHYQVISDADNKAMMLYGIYLC